MARTRNLVQLIADVRSRCDQVTANGAQAFISDAEICEWLCQADADLYDKLVLTGEQYFLTNPPPQFVTTSGQQDYPLPPDFYKLRGVDVQVGSYWSTCHRANFEQRNDFQNLPLTVWDWQALLYYDLYGQYLHFMQVLPGAQQIRLWYYPVRQRMSLNDGASGANSYLDGVNGWETYVIDYAAKMCAVRDENAELAQMLGADIAKTEDRIITMASSRNSGEAPKARVVRGRLWSPGQPRGWWGR